MKLVLKTTEAASLALYATLVILKNKERLITIREIAKELKVPRASLTIVLRRLVRSGILFSEPRPVGGFRLLKNPDELKIIELYEAIEGPYKPEKCLMEKRSCPADKCILGGLCEKVNGEIFQYLRTTSLSDVENKLKE